VGYVKPLGRKKLSQVVCRVAGKREKAWSRSNKSIKGGSYFGLVDIRAHNSSSDFCLEWIKRKNAISGERSMVSWGSGVGKEKSKRLRPCDGGVVISRGLLTMLPAQSLVHRQVSLGG
jgi:hypothetical protein